MITLRYGNTNTYFLDGLLIDTDMPGTLPALFGALKKNALTLADVRCVLATHYHPDHMGLIGELTARGAGLLLIDKQLDSVHFSDPIFARQKNLPYTPVCTESAEIIRCAESRSFLKGLGIDGEIIPTQSHSADGIALITDSGDCFAGDLEPPSFLGAYEDNAPLKEDWDAIFALRPKRVFFGHCNSITL